MRYNEEFKLKVVKEYLEGSFGYKLFAKKVNIPIESNIKNWVKVYQVFGLEDLQINLAK